MSAEGILTLIGLLIPIILVAYYIVDKKEKEKERDNMMDIKMKNTPPITGDLSDEEYKKQVLNMLNLINTNLLDQETKQNRIIEHLKDIRFCVNFITIVILINIIISIILFIAKVYIGASVTSNLFDILQMF